MASRTLVKPTSRANAAAGGRITFSFLLCNHLHSSPTHSPDRICGERLSALLRRFASRGALNSPWGVARASYTFGRFSGDILVGNFGNGRINVFDKDGRFIDELDGADGNPLMIDGLWTLTLGGGRASSSDTLYFTAGPSGETHGLFGTIMPVPD